MIEVRNVSKKFGRLIVLEQLSLQLNQGECIALIGPNGCGKTTLIKSILGMVLPDTGQIIFDGKDIANDNLYRKDIGYMPQIGRYPENMTIGQVLELMKVIRGHGTAADFDLYEELGVSRILDKKMRTLSGGTIQKVSAVLAFLFDPKVLILDEPTAGLDLVASEILREKIKAAKKEGRLILITSHQLSDFEALVSEVVFMQDGRLVLHNNAEALKQMTGTPSLTKSIIRLLKPEAK